jgi:hypothetical protein
MAEAESQADCPFCQDRPDGFIAERPLAFLIWDAFPVAQGHALVIPRRHISSWIDATPEEIRGGWIFFDYVCTECHVVHGAGGTRGPDLTHTGAEHSREWLGNQILFPLDHKSDGEMPAFEGKISEGDLESLLDYLELLR